MARSYLRTRFSGHEDRFMELYGAEDWDSCNMEIVFHFDAEGGRDREVKRLFRERLERVIEKADPETSLFYETGMATHRGVRLVRHQQVDVEVLSSPNRQGLHFIWDEPGRIRVVWNHVQCDGVGIWDTLREIFDPSPPLVQYRDMPKPPPFLPEIAGLPATLRRIAWRGSLDERCDGRTQLVHIWPTAAIRERKNRLGLNFNVVSAALMLDHIFDRHPDLEVLCAGMLVFFDFLQARNRYGVLPLRVRRASVDEMARQIARQTRFPMVRWGAASLQSWILSRLPQRSFEPVMRYLRRQIDVVISNLPVGTTPAMLGGTPITISCHPWQQSAPYYVLAVGTSDTLHMSVNSRFDEDPSFMATPEAN